jgi:hypothetical protein
VNNIVLKITFLGFCVVAFVSLNAENAATPEVIVLDGLVEKFEPVTFDHATHTMLSEDCSTCHHQHSALESQSCSGCHSIDSAVYKKSLSETFFSCRKCHGDYDGDNPNKPTLKVAYHQTCFECHGEMSEFGKDPKSCEEVCHSRKSQEVGANKPNQP